MSHTLTPRITDGILVCTITGRLDAVSADAAATELLALLETENNTKVLLNLEQLDYVSSLGLRVFVRAAKVVNGNGGTLKLCSATPPVKKVLEISALDSLLDLRDDEDEALSSF